MNALATQTVSIDLQTRSYDIVIGSGIFDQAATYADLPNASTAVIVTNTTVAPLFAARLQQALQGKYPKIHTVVLPDGEAFKTWQTLNLIFDALLAHTCDRKTVLFALGGGEQVLDDAGNPLLIDGSVCGTWIARRAMSLGEAPGVPTAEETAANVFDWDLVARFATPTFVAKRGTKRITLGATPANVSIYLADSGLATLASTVKGSVNISLVDADGHNVQLRELNVCQNGVMRKMIILASEIYD